MILDFYWPSQQRSWLLQPPPAFLCPRIPAGRAWPWSELALLHGVRCEPSSRCELSTLSSAVCSSGRSGKNAMSSLAILSQHQWVQSSSWWAFIGFLNFFWIISIINHRCILCSIFHTIAVMFPYGILLPFLVLTPPSSLTIQLRSRFQYILGMLT